MGWKLCFEDGLRMRFKFAHFGKVCKITKWVMFEWTIRESYYVITLFSFLNYFHSLLALLFLILFIKSTSYLCYIIAVLAYVLKEKVHLLIVIILFLVLWTEPCLICPFLVSWFECLSYLLLKHLFCLNSTRSLMAHSNEV